MDDDMKPGAAVPGLPTPHEAELAAFFADARKDPPEPPLALLSAILADAGTLRPVAVAPPARPGFRRRRAGMALGGWGGASALAASALLGFWIGLAGSFSIDGTTLQAGTGAVATDDPVLALLDYDTEE